MLAIEESRKLQAEKPQLQLDYLAHLKAFQFAVLESAMFRIEIRAHRDDREYWTTAELDACFDFCSRLSPVVNKRPRW